MWNNIYSEDRLIIDEHIAGVLSLRVSALKDYHWQGECILAPQYDNLLFNKKYDKINIIKNWMLVKEYSLDPKICAYRSIDEEYIMTSTTAAEDITNNHIYNVMEITE